MTTFEDIWRLMTDSYRAGAGLPPLKQPPEDSDEDEPDREPGDDTSDWPDDHRLDDPRHGQAESINRERYKP